MKSPAFQWYAADYLADERVMLLSLESEAAYVRLLNYCWREGSIPANPALCAPMCKYADAKVIKPALALFMKSPSQPGRLIHKRLEEERAKQEAFRARQSEKGAKGGRPRKDEEKPKKPTALPGLNHGLTGEKPEQSPRMPSSLSSTSSTNTTDVVAAAPATGYPVLEAEEETYDFARSFFSTDKWPAVVADVRKVADYAMVNFDHYRDEIRLADTVTPQRLPNRHWRKKLMNWLKNDLKDNVLVKVALSLQPKGKADNEPDYRLNNAAVARRRREQEERESQMLAANLARVAASDARQQATGQITQPLPG